MSEQLILDIPSFLGWSFLCVVNGMFFGCAVYALTCQILEQAGYKPVDHDAEQAKADELFARVRVRAK